MFFFFFSSRRRHTRLTCDWSSDVCSSDLKATKITKLFKRKIERTLRGLCDLRGYTKLASTQKFVYCFANGGQAFKTEDRRSRIHVAPDCWHGKIRVERADARRAD